MEEAWVCDWCWTEWDLSDNKEPYHDGQLSFCDESCAEAYKVSGV